MEKLTMMTVLGLLVLVILTGCSNGQNSSLAPIEQEQIENVVKDYVVRDTNIPDYEVTIEEVANDWARVSLAPTGGDSEETILYLQKQIGPNDAPTAIIAELPGHEARASATTGWTIILGPQASYSKAELDEVGVPETLHP